MKALGKKINIMGKALFFWYLRQNPKSIKLLDGQKDFGKTADWTNKDKSNNLITKLESGKLFIKVILQITIKTVLEFNFIMETDTRDNLKTGAGMEKED
jgi:hypothetical protein